MKNKPKVTVKLTDDNTPVYLFFIDGVLFPQKGFNTEKEAYRAGLAKAKQL